jgi:tripeptidyl-peptidase-1
MADAIIAHLQPSQESIAAFNAFASANGLQATVAAGHGEWMSLTTNVSHANTLFAASFQNFQHKSAAEPIVRTLSYSLPSTLADHVDTVYPTTSFEFSAPRARTSQASTRRTRARRQASSSAQSCSTLVTPSCLQTMYNIPPRAANASGVSILITGYVGIAPQLADNEVSRCLLMHRAC